MRNVRAIAARELKAYFNSPIAYIVIVAFLGISGFLFFTPTFAAGVSSMRMFFQITPLLLVVFAPAISMRLVSEELRSGTLELLTTMPIQDHEVIVGKFFGALGVVCAALLCTVSYAITIESIGDLDWGPVIGGYIGLILCASALIAIGLLASTLNRNQIVAFIIGLVICLGLWMLDKVTLFFSPQIGTMLEYLSIDYHFRNIARGVIDTRDVLYYLSVTAAALFGAVRSLGRHHA